MDGRLQWYGDGVGVVEVMVKEELCEKVVDVRSDVIYEYAPHSGSLEGK